MSDLLAEIREWRQEWPVLILAGLNAYACGIAVAWAWNLS